ncbi:MAG TPA: hypothetical protein VGM03_22985 [Phycisphaerae bacterium]|jgi:hypothetical protein
MKPKAYLETTIVSYLAARRSRDLVIAAHQRITHGWWNERRQRYDLYASEAVQDEAERGDHEAARRRVALLASCRLLAVDSEAVALGEALLATRAVPASAPADAPHRAGCRQRNGLSADMELQAYQ